MLTTYISCSNSSFNDTEKRTNCFEIYYLSDFWCSLVISLLSVATINILNYQICQVCFFYHIFLSSFLLHPHKRNSIIHHFGWTQWSLKLLLLKAEQMYNFFCCKFSKKFSEIVCDKAGNQNYVLIHTFI